MRHDGLQKGINGSRRRYGRSGEVLRKNGLALAAKKAGRIAAEGLVAFKVSEDGKQAAIVEVNSETISWLRMKCSRTSWPMLLRRR